MEREQYPVKSRGSRLAPSVNGTRVRCHIYLKSSSLRRYTDEKSFLECELSLEHHGCECVIEGIVEHFSHANTLPNADP